MPITAFGWHDEEAPALDAANLEAAHAHVATYAETVAAAAQATAETFTTAALAPGMASTQRAWEVAMTHTAANDITVGTNPHGVAITPDGSKVLVCNYNTGTVSVVDTASQAVTATWTIAGARSVAITPDGITALVTQYQTTGHVVPVTIATGGLGTPILVGGFPNGLSIRPAGDVAYVATNAGVFPIALPALTVGAGIATSQAFTDVCFTPNGVTAFATSSVLSTTTGVTPITVSGGTAGSIINCNGALVEGIVCNGTTVFTLAYSPGYLIPITVSTLTMQPWIWLPGNPSYLCLSPNGHVLWIGTYSRCSMLPVNTSTLQLGPEVFSNDPAKLTLRPAVSPDGTKLYCSSGLLSTSNTLLVFNLSVGANGYAGASVADVIGTDGLIGGPGSVGLTRWTSTLVAPLTFTTTAENVVLISPPIPANFMTPGTHFRVTLRGVGSAASAGNMTASLRIGTTGTVADQLICSPAASGSYTTAQGVEAVADVTVNAVGNPGQIIGNMRTLTANLGGRQSAAAAVNYNSRVVNFLTLTATASGTTPQLIVTNVLIELVAF